MGPSPVGLWCAQFPSVTIRLYGQEDAVGHVRCVVMATNSFRTGKVMSIPKTPASSVHVRYHYTYHEDIIVKFKYITLKKLETLLMFYSIQYEYIKHFIRDCLHNSLIVDVWWIIQKFSFHLTEWCGDLYSCQMPGPELYWPGVWTREMLPILFLG